MHESIQSDANQSLQTLRQHGAHQFDPLTFHYLEALSARASTQPDRVKRMLDAKVHALVGDYRARLDRARDPNNQIIAAPEPAEPPDGLKALVRHMALQVPDHAAAQIEAPSEAHTDLKSIKYFRNTWSKLSAHQQVNQALGQAPKNAGPLNSHAVALRSLATMRDLSPDYLNRFMTYMDTLLRLDEVGTSKKTTPPRNRAG